jgi:hypothetical protein
MFRVLQSEKNMKVKVLVVILLLVMLLLLLLLLHRRLPVPLSKNGEVDACKSKHV